MQFSNEKAENTAFEKFAITNNSYLIQISIVFDFVYFFRFIFLFAIKKKKNCCFSLRLNGTSNHNQCEANDFSAGSQKEKIKQKQQFY